MRIIKSVAAYNPQTRFAINGDIPQKILYSSTAPLRLKMPNGFVAKRDGITNKGNSSTGLYIDIDVRRILANKDMSEQRESAGIEILTARQMLQEIQRVEAHEQSMAKS